MTKRILAMLLAVLLAVSCFALTACGGEEEKPNEKPGNTQTPGNTDPGTTPGTTPGTGEEEGTAPQVVTYTETIVIGEEADPYGADLYVFISGNDEGAVTFKSSNDAVFTVDANGTITPVAPGTAKLTITAKAGELETTKEVDVTIREIWNPTDAVSKEVVSIMRNKELINCPLSLYNANFSGSTYNTEGVEGTTAGPVEIWGSEPHLQFLFVIPKEGDNTIDATAGFGTEDYAFSFKFFVREQNLEDDRTDYKTVHTNLVPWSIYGDPTLTIYRACFYESGLLDLVEVDTTYDLVVVVYEGSEARAWGSATFTWTDSCELFVEAAENNAEVIK